MGNASSIDIWTIAQTGEVPKQTFCRSKPYDVRITDGDGNTPLHWAALNDRPAAVRFLLECGADPTVRTRQHETPLYLAVKAGSVRAALQLLQAERVSPPYDYGNPPLLHLAVGLGLTEVVRALLARNVSVHTLDFHNQTALHLAVTQCADDSTEVVRMLVEAGAPVCAQDDRKRTPLHLAIERHLEEVIELLVKAGASLGLRQLEEGHSVFHLVASRGDVSTARFLLSEGASAVAVDNQGRSPLHLATLAGFSEFVRLLLDVGAPVDCRNNHGQTPLHCLAFGDILGCACLLIDAGAEVDATDGRGRTPLHCAAAKIHGADVVRLLLLHGARVDASDADGYQPLHLAAQNGNAVTAWRLAGAGASLDAKNGEGLTPFAIAQLHEWDMKVLSP